MCITGLSESGHGGRFEPCEEYKRLLQRSRELTANLDNKVELLEAENVALRRQDEKLCEALKAVEWTDMGGPTGGNCPGCGNAKFYGHAPECLIGNALKETE